MAASHRVQACALFAALLITYNANGRESGYVDTQPAKYLAAGIALRHTLTLDAIIEQQPGLAARTAFQRDRQGHWRSAYPILAGVVAAVPAVLLQTLGIVQMDAPRAPNLVAALTASALTAAAVVLVFLSLTRIVPQRLAMVTAIGLGLGTNYWAVVSQTLGQQEVVAFGMAVALWAWWRTAPLTWRHLALGAVGVAMAGAARPQVSLLIVTCLVALARKVGWRRLLWPLAIVAVVAVAEISRNVHWFGHPLGAVMQIESVHPVVHDVEGVLADRPWINAAGLLVSPSRGLFVFSPVLLLACVGMWRSRWTPDLRWLATAVLLQFTAYACYSVWWGGHSFGPRYLLDVLVPLAPFGALGVAYVASRPIFAAAGILLLVWSVTVAGLGAFVYPNERWNTDPSDIDRNHERLWDWRDSQISRAWRGHASPQNFDLFTRSAVRRDPP